MSHPTGESLQSLPDPYSPIAEVLPDTDSWQLDIDEDDRDVVHFVYPSTTEKVEYVRPTVRLELGTHAELIPNDHYSITPYAADHFAQVFEDAACPVRAIKAERTFWEKATILHQEHHRTSERGAPTRLSRHHYDVFMMFADQEIRQRALLPRIASASRRPQEAVLSTRMGSIRPRRTNFAPTPPVL